MGFASNCLFNIFIIFLTFLFVSRDKNVGRSTLFWLALHLIRKMRVELARLV